MKNKNHFNYTKACRKRTGLSQSELAFLMGMKSSSFICRTELGNEISSLSKALSYNILYDKQMPKLFPELSIKVAMQIFSRIAKLSSQLEKQTTTPLSRKKIETLEKMAIRIASKYKNI